MQVVIRSNLIEVMNEYMEVYLSIHSDHAFWKENMDDRVKLLESNILNYCLKITAADLHKIGLKMRE